MSFSDLRAARKTKSYVDRSSGPNVHEPLIVEQRESVISTDIYTSLPPAIGIRTTDASGRGLYSNAQLTSGSVLLSVKPHVAALSIDKLHEYCSYCFSPAQSTGLKRCTQCHHIYYCDATCQTKDWSVHKHECASLQRWAAAAPSQELAIPSDAVRCIARILWIRQKKGPTSVWSREVDSMQSHRKGLPISAAEMHTHLAHSLVQYLGLSSPQDQAEFGIHSAGELLDLTSRFTTNTFAVTDPTLTPLGASVSPVIALFNHSCQPNAVVVFPRASANPRTSEPAMQVVVIRDIMPGEEILTAYIDTTLPRVLRQRLLEETYHFDCQCQLCTLPPPVDPRESMRCPKACSGVCPLPTEDNPLTRCDRCKSAVASTDDVLDALRVGQQGLDKATALQFKDPSKALQLTSKLIPILTSSGLTPSSHPLLGLVLLQKSFPLPDPLTQDALDDSIRISSKAITGLLAIHPEGHPVVGIALAELGKLLSVDEPSPSHASSQNGTFPPSGPPRVKMAYDTLLRARASLMVGFGEVNEGGAVGREVRNMIAALEKEIEVWKQGVKNVLDDVPK